MLIVYDILNKVSKLGLMLSLFVFTSSFANNELYLENLNRILYTYSLQAEDGINFESPKILNPDVISVEILDPASLKTDNSSQDLVELIELNFEELSNEEGFYIEEKITETYNEIIKREQSFLTEKEEFEGFLYLYRFLQSLKPHFYNMKDLQVEIHDSFSELNKAVVKKNVVDKQIEEYKKEYSKLKDKRGSLSLLKIEQKIDFYKRRDTFSSNSNIKEVLKQTQTYIKSFYQQIDSKKQSLLQRNIPIFRIICDSQIYKSSHTSCLSIFDLQDKNNLDYFINSLSPEQWRSLKREIQPLGNVSLQNSKEMSAVLLDTVQQSDLLEMIDLFQEVDFFRWLYFTLRDSLQERSLSQEEWFSWNLISEKLEEEQQKKENLETSYITISFDEKQFELERADYSKKMHEKEEEYFVSLVSAQSLISFALSNSNLELKGTEIACLLSDLNSTSQWSICIEKYIQFLSSQEELKKTWESHLNQNLKKLVATSIALKKYIELTPTNNHP